jgi:hypothetical protein
MGKIVISGPQNISLDGVVQDPTGEEGFRLGGWFTQFGGKDLDEWSKIALTRMIAPVDGSRNLSAVGTHPAPGSACCAWRRRCPGRPRRGEAGGGSPEAAGPNSGRSVTAAAASSV